MAHQAGAQNCAAFYVDRTVVCSILSDSPQHTLRQALLLPEYERIKRRPVLFFQGCDDGPYMLVLLDYVANKVLLFRTYGRNLNDTRYASWNHGRLWKGIANALGWVTVDEEPSAFSMDWVQVNNT